MCFRVLDGFYSILEKEVRRRLIFDERNMMEVYKVHRFVSGYMPALVKNEESMTVENGLRILITIYEMFKVHYRI